MVDFITPFLVVFTVIAQGIILWTMGESIYVASRTDRRHSAFLHFLHQNAILGGFIISLIAMLGSLYYSDVMGYAPCFLCWYQRIFMYPQVFLFAAALWKNEKTVWLFTTTLSIIGAAIAAAHYYIQMAGSNAFCNVVGYSASCSETFSANIGYITIPMMALSAFLLVLVLSFIQRKNLY